MSGFFIPAIAERVKQLWDIWNIRGALLFSLWLQTILIFVAPFRKSAKKNFVILLIWFSYLMADATANFSIGLISNSQRIQSNKSNHQAKEMKDNPDLLAFWAPFVLIHLGGSDNITAFALEDNQLWLRHLLGLIFQVAAIFYVFIQSLPNDNLWIPTVLIFIAGIIKYVERTRALLLASLNRVRDSMLKEPDPGQNYPKFMEQYIYKKNSNLPTSIQLTPEPDKEIEVTDIAPNKGELTHLEVVYYAYRYFNIFKGLIVNLIFTIHERDESRKFFNSRTPDEALRIIEVELNFLYGALYTKVEVVHSVVGYIFRFLAFSSVLAAFGIFYFRTNKKEFAEVEIGITYILLVGAIALDVISFIMLIFSDWTFASIKNYDLLGKFLFLMAAIYERFLALKKYRWHLCTCRMCKENKVKHHVMVTPPAFRRWSGVISKHNLIGYCLKSKMTTHEFISLFDIIWIKILGCLEKKKVVERFRIGWSKSCKGTGSMCSITRRVREFSGFIEKKVIQYFSPVFVFVTNPIKDYVDQMLYVSLEPFTLELWEIIFEEVRNKTEFTDDPETAERIFAARGDWVLTDMTIPEDYSSLLKSVAKVPYDESLLLWHIATDLCYYSDEGSQCSDDSLTLREISKTLSDYMLYLLVFQPTMMSPVAGVGKIRFQDTCAEAKRFFERNSLQPNEEKKACEKILSVNTDVEPIAVKGYKSKSVLFDASILAKELNRIQHDKKWKLMSRVWVELLSYAASHSRPSTHAQQVSMGGELITFIWLLLAHFGLGEQFKINKERLLMGQYGVGKQVQNYLGIAKGQLIVGK